MFCWFDTLDAAMSSFFESESMGCAVNCQRIRVVKIFAEDKKGDRKERNGD